MSARAGKAAPPAGRFGYGGACAGLRRATERSVMPVLLPFCAHQTPEPEIIPPTAAPTPAPAPEPPDIPAPAHAPVTEPTLAPAPIRA